MKPPDVIVRHGSPFVRIKSVDGHAAGPTKPRLTRVSGRDGRILWDVPLSEEQDPNNNIYVPDPGFADLDGDGALDVVLALGGAPGTGRPDHELRAVSLEEGRQLWSLHLDFKNSFMTNPQLAVADLDGDKRPDVVVTEQPAAGDQQTFALKVLNGRDGSVRWTWNAGTPQDPNLRVDGWLALADFAGDGRQTICLRLLDHRGRDRVVVFDERGHECASRDLPKNSGNYVTAADVNGDGRDELLVHLDNRLHVWTRWPERTSGSSSRSQYADRSELDSAQRHPVRQARHRDRPALARP